eukprot:516840-Rhodomonas_salina.7
MRRVWPDPTTDPTFLDEGPAQDQDDDFEDVHMRQDVGESRWPNTTEHRRPQTSSDLRRPQTSDHTSEKRRPQTSSATRRSQSRGRSETSLEGFDFLCRSSAGNSFKDLRDTGVQSLWEENPTDPNSDEITSPSQPDVRTESGANELPHMIPLGNMYAIQAKAAGRTFYSIPSQLPTPRIGTASCSDAGCQTEDVNVSRPPSREELLSFGNPMSSPTRRGGGSAVRFRGEESPSLGVDEGVSRTGMQSPTRSAHEISLASPISGRTMELRMPRRASLREDKSDVTVNLKVASPALLCVRCRSALTEGLGDGGGGVRTDQKAMDQQQVYLLLRYLCLHFPLQVETFGGICETFCENLDITGGRTSYPYCLVDVEGQVERTAVEPNTQVR